MRIIFDKDGKLSQMIPASKFLAQLTGTEEEKMIHLANKTLPTGTKYEIVADDYVTTDRSFRDAWEYVAGGDEKTSADLDAADLSKYNMKENL